MNAVQANTIKTVLQGLGVSPLDLERAMPILQGKGFSTGEATSGLCDMKFARQFLGGVSRHHVLRSIKSGQLRSTHFGRRLLFARKDLEEFLKSLRDSEAGGDGGDA